MANQSRKWQLTLNNPEEKGYTHDKIKELINELKSVVYYCLADEIGLEEKTPHTHIYIASKSPIRFNTIKKKFPEAHIEVANGSSEDNRNYIEKSGKWENDDKHGTQVEGSFEEYGDLPIENQGKRNDLTLLYNMIKDGLSNYEIVEAYPDYMFRINDIERTRQMLKAEEFRNTFRQLEVTYIYGATGSGKSRSVLENHGYSNCYRVTNYLHPFDSYSGQDVIVFEEYRSQIRISELLNYLDGYPLELPARYSNKIACYTKVYIISNIAIEDQYPMVQLEQFETWKALIRRINKVIVFDALGKYVEYTTEKYLNRFIEIGDIHDTPFNEIDNQQLKGKQLSLREKETDTYNQANNN